MPIDNPQTGIRLINTVLILCNVVKFFSSSYSFIHLTLSSSNSSSPFPEHILSFFRNQKHSGGRFFNKLSACHLNEARIRCRDVERKLTTFLKENKIRKVTYKYVNRLSDYLFCLAIYVLENYRF